MTGRPNQPPNQPELPIFEMPTVVIPAIRVPQPDGSILIRAGKPYIAEPEMGISEAAKVLGLSARYLEYQCSIGVWKSARKPGGMPRSRWRISRAEVLQRAQAQPGE
jgi:hypothetical protein